MGGAAQSVDAKPVLLHVSERGLQVPVIVGHGHLSSNLHQQGTCRESQVSICRAIHHTMLDCCITMLRAVFSGFYRTHAHPHRMMHRSMANRTKSGCTVAM